MAENHTVTALYAALVAAGDTDLDPRAQRRILAHANASGDSTLAAALVARHDACDEVLDAAKDHPAAAVAAAWYANPRTSADAAAAQIRRERRPSVLTALASRSDTPAELLCELALSTSSVKVSTALLNSRQLSLPAALAAAEIALATKPPADGKVAGALRVAAGAQPLLAAALIDGCTALVDACRVVALLGSCDPAATAEALDRLARRTLAVVDRDRNQMMELRSAVEACQLLVRGDWTGAAAAQHRKLIEWIPTADAVVALPYSTTHMPLAQLRETLAAVSDPCEALLADADPHGPPDEVRERCAAASLAIIEYKRDQLLTQLPRSRSLEDYAFSVISSTDVVSVQTAALVALTSAQESLAEVIRRLRAAAVKLPVASAAAALRSAQRWELLERVAAVCEDPDAFLDALLRSPDVMPVAARLHNCGMFDAARVDAAARAVTVAHLLEHPPGPPGRLRETIAARVAALVADELGDDPCAWEAFESTTAGDGSRFDAGTPIVQLAQVAAAITSPAT